MSIIKSQKTISLLSTFAIILCCFFIVILQKSKLGLEQAKEYKDDYFKQEEILRANLSILKTIPDFGFNNLVANWMYLNFIQYFGDGKAREQTGYSLSPEYFEAVVDRDPRFVEAFFLLSPATSLFAGQPRKNVALLKQSLDSVSPEISSQAYYLWIYKGIDELLMLGDGKAAQKSYEMAAQWAEASDDPAIKERAASARRTAQFIAKNPDSKVSRIGAWTMVLSSATDEKTQQRAIQEIEALGGEIITTPEGRLSVKVPEE